MDRAGLAVITEKIREFDKVASALEIPMVERLGILNVPADLYLAFYNQTITEQDFVKPELERRLSYALPLMRRLAKNSPSRRLMAACLGMGQQAA